MAWVVGGGECTQAWGPKPVVRGDAHIGMVDGGIHSVHYTRIDKGG